jgi:LysR family transcriptional regulator, chromosome initiation inhibitor
LNVWGIRRINLLDYKLLEALAAVVEQASFERAGQALGLTQSAVSQRIKLLEARLGQPVLIRSPGLQPTDMGRQLLFHVQQVQLLEQDLNTRIPVLGSSETRLRIALNADSLATWWPAAVTSFCRRERVLLDVVIEDQDVGLRRMRDGEVAGCLCSAEQAVQGARSVFLGSMTYRAYASAGYVAQHFADGLTDAALATAPAIVFGPHDQLQERFCRSAGYSGHFPYHLCPSSEGFVRMAGAGMGYGLMPELQVGGEVAAGLLLDIAPDRAIEVPLYWHYWRQGGALLEGLTRELLRSAPFDRQA